MHSRSYYLINGLTYYRIVASVFLLYLIITDQPHMFKWMLLISFFTDSIDGFLARKYHVKSTLGASLDSAGDDLTVIMGVIGAFVWKREFITEYIFLLVLLGLLFAVQLIISLIKYRKPTSFHTYLAKAAAIFQGLFLILLYFLPEAPTLLFYFAIAITFIELAEEIIIVCILPEWKTDVKGLYWIWKK